MRELIYFLHLANDLDIKIGKPQLQIDNTGVINLSKKGLMDRTRHILVKYLYVKELQDAEVYDIFHVKSRDNLADILSKNAKVNVFERCKACLGLVELRAANF